MRRLIISLVVMVTMQSAFATDRLSALPCPILGGELSNSAATSVADIDEVMPRMKALGLNTVLVPAYWELMEPVEGKFNFTLIDRTIDGEVRFHTHRSYYRRGTAGAVARGVPLVWCVEEFYVVLYANMVQTGYKAIPTSNDCRGEADGDSIVLQRQCAAGRPERDSIVLQRQCAAGRPESILGPDAAYPRERPAARGGHYDADRKRDRYVGVGTRPFAIGREGL